VTFELIRSSALVRPASGEVHLLDPRGVSVISDIDDTIKISQVRNRSELARNTFCRPFKAVPGMSGLYQSWRTNAGAQFHYVSASPWQLYEPLSEFIRSNAFPAGTFHMKHFRVKDETFWDLFQSPERYKPDVIAPILERFPERRFLLVGDSGEKDPEVYGALARRHRKQIVRICIRDVTGEPEVPRYRNAFKGLPRDLWTVFKDPAELATLDPKR
jgi:phosphatidate phosphatase APP1